MSESSSIVSILWRYRQKEQLTKEELSLLRLWLMESVDHQLLFDDLSNDVRWEKEIAALKLKDSEATWRRISERIKKMEPLTERSMIYRWRYAAAAILFILFSGLAWLLLHKGHRQDEGSYSKAARNTHDILPGTSTAVLTLSDGSTINLDSIRDGAIPSQDNTSIFKKDSGLLSYQVQSGTQTLKNSYNTLTTPKAAMYGLVLPDGSRVWLNAASSLRFPVAFRGDQRNVELTGEAYFEVQRDTARPFIVSANGTTVKVLGTHFNVNAYTDEADNEVTLEEGSVEVNRSVVIKPGQQARAKGGGQTNIVKADLETVLGWKEGNFVFKDESLDELLKQVSRWYDAGISYEAKIPGHFNATIPRNVPVSQLLHLLEGTGHVHFVIEDKKIIVMK